MDRALDALYDSDRRGGLGGSDPSVSRWLGDVRDCFPAPVVQVPQRGAFERLDLERMLTGPEGLEAVTPDVNLVSTLIAMRGLGEPLRRAVTGAVDRASRDRRPRHAEIDRHRTVRANLRHYQAEYGTIMPENRIGHGRRRHASLKDVVLCIDQSGSVANSVVYAARRRHRRQQRGRLLPRPHRPAATVLVLISDLYEGGMADALLALSDEGAPSCDRAPAAKLAARGVPSFACTPDLTAAAIRKGDLTAWAARAGLAAVPADPGR